MKKLLRTKFNSIFLFLIAAIVIPFQYSSAAEPLDSYKKLFESWGLEIDTLNTQQIGENAEDLLLTYERKKDGDEYLLLLTSQEYFAYTSYANVILICDNSLLSGASFPVECTSTSLDGFDFRTSGTQESAASNKISGSINPVVANSTNYYFVPEILMVSPNYRSVLADYFKALSKADDIKIRTKESGAGSTLINELKKIKDSTLFETALYAFFLLVIVVIASGLLKMLVLNPKELLRKEVYLEKLNVFLAFLRLHWGIFALCLFILAFLYIPIIYALKLRGNVLGIPQYAYLYIKNTLLPTNYKNTVMAKDLFKIGFLLYNYLLSVLILLVAIPKVATIVSLSFNKLQSVRLNKVLVKWLVPVVVAASMVTLAFYEIGDVLGFLSFNVGILFLAFLYIRRIGTDFGGLFKKKEAILVALTLFVILGFSFIYPTYKQKNPVSYTKEPLIGSNDSVVLFPYSKKWGERVLFETHFYEGVFEMFADSYLIYSPDALKVVNKPLDRFSNEKSFIILSGERTETAKAVLKNPDILKYIRNESYTPLFVIEPSKRSDVVTANIGINCLYSPNSSTLTMEVFTSDSDDRNKVNKSKIDVLKFPGCEPDSVTKVYEVPLDIYLLPDQKLFIVLGGVDEQTLIDFRLFGGGVEIPVTFLKSNILNENIYSIVYKSPVIGNDLYAYSTRVKEEVSFDMNFTEEGFDLSEPINDLMKHGFLNNPFIIWSSGGVEVIDR